MTELTSFSLLFMIGLIAGAYGVMVGAGGGFIFVPALLIIFHLPPEKAVGTGLAIVLINALSGVLGYVKQKRINYKMGILISIGAIPGTFIGSWLIQFGSTEFFYVAFASMLISLGLFLMIKKAPHQQAEQEVAAAIESAIPKKNLPNALFLLLIGLLLGTLSNYLGIGGGWLLVPILIYLFHVVPHQATATSIFSLCIYSFIGLITQVYQGHIDWSSTLFGGLGVLIGAQIGVYLSCKLSGKLIIQMLSFLLIGVGIKLFFR
jgi:uncharacterized protein